MNILYEQIGCDKQILVTGNGNNSAIVAYTLNDSACPNRTQWSNFPYEPEFADFFQFQGNSSASFSQDNSLLQFVPENHQLSTHGEICFIQLRRIPNKLIFHCFETGAFISYDLS